MKFIKLTKNLIACVDDEDFEEDAALAYNQAAIKYFGEFARINK